MVVLEREFDGLPPGQEWAGLAAVLTLGPASIAPASMARGRLVGLSPWLIAHDADPAGDEASEAWTSKCCRRVRPPEPFKDWCDAAKEGVDLRRWWSQRLTSNPRPALFSWAELAAM